jgi:Domain of unknown function (DUF4920)
MKKNILFLALAILTLGACKVSQSSGDVKQYGERFTAENVLSLSDLQSKMQTNDKYPCVFEGNIVETCQSAGCWMTVALPSGEPMTVFMKDHGFAVPTSNCSGKKAFVKGEAFYKELSVAQLKHLAEDAGKPKAEIDAITEPKRILAFTAVGVQIAQGGKAGKATEKGENCAH